MTEIVGCAKVNARESDVLITLITTANSRVLVLRLAGELSRRIEP